MVRFVCVFFTLISISLFSSEPVHLSQHSVDVRNGHFTESNTDIYIPGPRPLFLTRTYSGPGSTWQWQIEDAATSVHEAMELIQNHEREGAPPTVRVVSRSTQDLFSEAALEWERNRFWLRIHDGQIWEFVQEGLFLKEVLSNEGSMTCYEYDQGQIVKRISPDGTILINQLFPKESENAGKVYRQFIQSSKDDEPHLVAEYEYKTSETLVLGGNGGRTLYRFDGSLITEISFEDRKELYRWLETKPLLIEKKILDKQGCLVKKVEYGYDYLGRRIRETLTGNLTGSGEDSYSYYRLFNSDGQIAQFREDNGNKTTLEYDPVGRYVTSMTSEALTVTIDYDNRGVPTAKVIRDRKKGLIHEKIITPSEAAESAGLPMIVEEFATTQNGETILHKTTLNIYGKRGQIVEMTVIDHLKNDTCVVRKEYDALGREISSEKTDAGLQSVAYTPFEKVQTEMSKEGWPVTKSHTFNPLGQLTRFKDALGYETECIYDRQGRLSHIISPPVLNENEDEYRPITQFEYDALNHMVKRIDPDQKVTRYEYTARGQVCRVIYPDGSEDRTLYNPDGSFASFSGGEQSDTLPLPAPQIPGGSDLAETTVDYQYIDERGRRVLLTSTRYEDGTTANTTYDALGRVESITLINPEGDVASRRQYRYNEGGQLALERETSSEQKEVRWIYDEAGRILKRVESSLTNETEVKITYYDSRQRIKLITDSEGAEVHFEYNDSGRISRVYSPDGSFHYEYHYDAQDHIVRIIDSLPDSQPIEESSPFSVRSLLTSLHRAASFINRRIDGEIDHFLEDTELISKLTGIADQIGVDLLGEEDMRFLGFHPCESATGIFGHGFEPKKYRVTFVNGILTTMEHLENHMTLISESHGGCNIHYCYVGTGGWTNDLIRAVFSKGGVVNAEAEELASIWRRQIEDLGGVGSGGIIFHYAHSLGGTTTNLAKNLMTPEELKMIRVITMGSPTLIRDDSFHSVTNIISCRDCISFFDPIGFISAIVFEGTNSVIVGTDRDDLPYFDHPFYGYWTHLKNHFWEELEEFMKELQ